MSMDSEALERRLKAVREEGVTGHLGKEFENRSCGDKRQPTVFFLPELEARPFWDPNDDHLLASAISTLETSATEIRNEYRSLTDKTPGCLSKHANGGSWTQHYLMVEGRWDDNMVARCPKTVEVLSALPLCESGLGYVYFSTLDPGASIRPHYGATNVKLRIQLALEVGLPSMQATGAVLTVGGIDRGYQQGKALAFDDTYLHSVTNPAGEIKRTVLLVDIWHPAILRSPHLRQRIVEVFAKAGDTLINEACHSCSQVITPSSVSVASMSAPFGILSREMILAIFNFASVRDLGACACVCCCWKVLADVDDLWRELHASEKLVDPQMEDSSSWKERVKYGLTMAVHFHKYASTGVGESVASNKMIEACRVFKLLMVGDPGVGKSSFLVKLSENYFTDCYIATIGVDFKMIPCTHRKRVYKLQVWDTAGPERFRTITSAYYRGCHGFFVMFDVASRSSFENTKNWMAEIERNAPRDRSVILLGLKNDLDGERRVVTQEEAKALAHDFNAPYAECSSKTGEGVDKAAELLVQRISRRLEVSEGTSEEAPSLNLVPRQQQQRSHSPAARPTCSLM